MRPLYYYFVLLLSLCCAAAPAAEPVSLSIAFHGEWSSAKFPRLKSTLDCQGKIRGTDKNGDGMITYDSVNAAANEATLFRLTCYFHERDLRGGWQGGCGPLTLTFKGGSFKVKAAPGSYTQGSPDLTITNLTWTHAPSARTCQLRVSDQYGPVLNVTDSGGSDDVPYGKGPKIWTFVAD